MFNSFVITNNNKNNNISSNNNKRNNKIVCNNRNKNNRIFNKLENINIYICVLAMFLFINNKNSINIKISLDSAF